MVHPDKIEWLNDLTEKIRRGEGMVFTNFKGLSVEELRGLRRDLYEHDTRFHVVKNRLARRAFNRVLNGGGESKGPDQEESSETPLEAISGLGPAKAEALQETGIDTARDLLEAAFEDLTAVSGIGEATAETLRENAREIVDAHDEEDDGGEEASSPDLLDSIEGFLRNNTAIAFSQNGFVNAAKVLIDFAEEHEALALKGGVLRDRVLNIEELETISELPSRRELLTTVARDLQSPIRRLARGLNYPVQRLVRVLRGLRDQREEAS